MSRLAPDAQRHPGRLPPAPDYRGACLNAVLAGCAGAIGAEATWYGGGAEDARQLLRVARSRRICLVLVDGLGAAQLEARSGHARFLSSRPGRRLTSAFPSTTAASLTALGTGQPPGVTSVAGFTMRNPASGDLVSMIAWQGADPLLWQRHETIFDQLAGQGCAAIGVLPSRFVGSGLSNAALRGMEARGADDPDALVAATVAALSEPGPGLVYVYWGELDHIGHGGGWQSHEWGEELGRVDAFAAQLAAAAPPHAAVYLTADHGMVDVAAGPSWDVSDIPRLAADVVAVGGEPRCAQLYTAAGAASAVAERWRAELGEAAWVMTREDACGQGLFGPLTDFSERVIGDVIVTMRGTATVVDARVHSAHFRSLPGQHGSLTADEVTIPFLRLA